MTAETYPSLEYGDDDGNERPSQKVRGKLSRVYVPTLDYWQYSVGPEGEDSVVVDPETIEEV